MRVAVFHDLGAGGAKRQLYEQCRALTARGHAVDVFTPAPSGAAAGEFLPLEEVCATVRVYGGGDPPAPTAARDAPSPGRLRRLLGGSNAGRAALEWAWTRRRLAGLRAYAALQQRIARDIDAGGYDLAYVNQSRQTLAPDLLAHLKQTRATPTLFCCNDTLRAAYEWAVPEEPGWDAPDTPLRRRRRGRSFSPALLAFDENEARRFVGNARTAGRIVANSWYTRERILATTGREARVLYPGVDAGFYRPDPEVPRNRSLVVSVGALLPTKRHDLVIRAVATLPAVTRPRVEVIGYEAGGEAGPVGRALCKLADATGVRLTLRRAVTDEIVRDAYRRAGVFAFAPYLEPLGIVPLEANACGAAVVGVAEAGIRETIRDGETGLLTGADPAEFGAALARVLADADLADGLGARGREIVTARWTWDRCADGLEELLRETVSGKGAAL